MNEMTRQNKKLVIIAICIPVIAIIFGLLYNVFIKGDGEKFSDKYLIVGNYLILQQTNTSWKQIKEYNDKLQSLTYKITDGVNTYNDVKLQYSQNNSWYFLKKDYTQINMPEFKIATHDLEVKIAEYTQENIINIKDDQYVTDAIKKYHMYAPDTYTAMKIVYDFDNDGQEEAIYSINNFTLEAVNYDIGGLMIMVDDGQITKIDKISDGPLYLMEILDLDNDGQYEIIVSKDVYNIPTFDSCYQIYKIKEGKWQLEKDCQS